MLRPSSRPSARPRTPSLETGFDPRRNGFDGLRLGLALLVAVSHGLDVGFGVQPSIGGLHLADLAVDAFFVVSGFLITRSLLRLPTVRRYAWHRFLRIMPGFWACLLVTAAVVAPVAAALEGRGALSVLTAAEDPAWRYPVANSTLLMLQYGIAGLGDGPGPPPTTLDGSLWTLKYEALGYAVLAGLALVAGLRRRRWPVLVLTGVVVAFSLSDAAGGPGLAVPALEAPETQRFLLAFCLGALGHLYGRHVPLSALWAGVAAATVVAAAVLAPDLGLLGAPGLAYLCLWAGIALPLPHPGWDLSYGVYVYHWPVQFVLSSAGLPAAGQVLFVLASLAVSLGVAALSWVLVERRAMSYRHAAWVDAPLRRSRAHAGLRRAAPRRV